MIGEIFPAKHSALKVLVNVDEIEFNVNMDSQETPGGGGILGHNRCVLCPTQNVKVLVGDIHRYTIRIYRTRVNCILRLTKIHRYNTSVQCI